MLHAQCTIALSSGFPISQGNAEAVDRWGGKTKHRLISYFLGNTSAKNYCNWIVCVKIIASQRWDVFFETRCSATYLISHWQMMWFLKWLTEASSVKCCFWTVITTELFLDVRLMQVGEEFSGAKSESLEESIRRQSLNYFRSYHRAKLDELRMFLENESWELCPVKPSFSILMLQVWICWHCTCTFLLLYSYVFKKIIWI